MVGPDRFAMTGRSAKSGQRVNESAMGRAGPIVGVDRPALQGQTGTTNGQISFGWRIANAKLEEAHILQAIWGRVTIQFKVIASTRAHQKTVITAMPCYNPRTFSSVWALGYDSIALEPGIHEVLATFVNGYRFRPGPYKLVFS